MNQEPEHTGEELIRLRAENRSLATDLYLAKKEAQDFRELLQTVLDSSVNDQDWSGLVEILSKIDEALKPKP